MHVLKGPYFTTRRSTLVSHYTITYALSTTTCPPGCVTIDPHTSLPSGPHQLVGGPVIHPGDIMKWLPSIIIITPVKQGPLQCTEELRGLSVMTGISIWRTDTRTTATDNRCADNPKGFPARWFTIIQNSLRLASPDAPSVSPSSAAKEHQTSGVGIGVPSYHGDGEDTCKGNRRGCGRAVTTM